MYSAHKLLLTALMGSVCGGIVLAQQVSELIDLIGARAAGGETQMEARGYRVVGGNTVRDQRFTFWWNDRKQECVSVSTIDGRYASIQRIPPGNCDISAAQSLAARPTYPEPRSDAASLVLVCYGAGTKPSVTTQPRYSWNSSKHKWEWSNDIVGTTQGFGSDVQIELYGDHGRIHLGPNLVPPIHSGGDNGWWDLDNLVVSGDRISASYRLNGMNKPRLTVDRRSGRITIQAITNFEGQCDIGNWSAGQRRF